MNKKYDFLVIGSGLSGLFYALKVADLGRVLVLSKSKMNQSNSHLAQGGVAAVSRAEDSVDKHISDTLTAGAGLCHQDVVKSAIEQGPQRIKDLVDMGVAFDLTEKSSSESESPPAREKSLKKFALTREGGHVERRIFHVQDYTGRAIQETLLKKAIDHPNIDVIENQVGIDLITQRNIDPFWIGRDKCIGAYIYDSMKKFIYSVTARWTVLATGGAGKIYLYTSNWSGATGDGIAMACRAGARVANMEFMQFHPTCLYHPDARNFLISEALRGEGAELVNEKGEAFMKNYHPLGSLAPRDIVARSIDAEMKRTGATNVYLDMTEKSRDYLKNRFPVIFNKCLDFGIDISEEPIPVVPAAHYLCGGVLTNQNGETDIEGLLAVGETACNGFHGANRLASNSLLDCTVFSHNAAEFCRENFLNSDTPKIIPRRWKYPTNNDLDERIVITHMWDEIRRLMWNYVGIVRSTKRLERAQSRLQNIMDEIRDYYSNFLIHDDILELRNLALVAQLTVECALKRKESIGIHYSLDFPYKHRASRAKDTVLSPTKQMSLGKN